MQGCLDASQNSLYSCFPATLQRNWWGCPNTPTLILAYTYQANRPLLGNLVTQNISNTEEKFIICVGIIQAQDTVEEMGIYINV